MYGQILIPLFIVSAGLNLSLAVYGWKHRHLPGAIAFSIAMLLFATLPLMQALNESTSELGLKVIALKSRVEAAGIGATAWLVMMLQLTGHNRLVNRRSLLALSIAPLTFLFLNWTENPLFRSNYYLDSSGMLRWSLGPAFFIGLAYLNVLLLAPLVLLWRSYRGTSPLSLRQTFALSLAAVLPVLLNLLIQLDILSMPVINFPFAAGPLMGLIVVWAVFRYHLFDVVPFARGLLIESMSDGVLVLDSQNRIVDINPAMQQLVGPITIGQSGESAFAAWPDLLSRFRDVREAETEVFLDDDPPQYFDLRISPLAERGGRLTGRLIVVRDITRQKQTEAALRASEKNFRQMLELAPDAMLIVDEAGTIKLANEQCERIFGYSKSDMVGHSVELLLPERFRPIHETHRAEYCRDPQVRPMGDTWQLSARRSDGSEFPVEISLGPLEMEDGLSVTASVRDITSRKQTQERLELQAAALRAAANAIVITDQDGLIEWVNSAFTHLTGYTFEESIGQNMRILRSYRHANDFYENLWGTIQAGLVWEDEIINVRKDGVEYVEQQTITPVMDEHGEIGHFISIKRDITARRKMEEALSDAEVKYRTLVEQMPIVVYMDELDESGSSAYVSPQIEALLGYPFAAWEQDPIFWKKCIHPDDYDRAIAVTHNTLTQGRVIEEYRMINRDGGVIWVRDHSILVHDATGQPKFVQGFWEDITERKRNEEILQRQNKYLETLHQITLDLLNQRATGELLQSIVNRASEFLDVPFCALMLLEGDELVVQAFTRNTPFLTGDRVKRGDAPLSWQAFDTRLPAVVNDYAHWPLRRSKYEEFGLSAVIALPILVGGRSIGVIELSTSKPGYVFDQSEIEAAALFAQLAGLALNNASLHAYARHEIAQRKQTEETLRTQNSYLAALHDVTLGLINRLDPDAVLEAILVHVTNLMHTRHALVDIVDPAENVLIQKVSIGNFVAQNGFRVTRGQGLTGHVWETGESMVIADYSTWEGGLEEFSWLRTVAGIPMKIEGRVIGVIGVSFDEPDRVFQPEDLQLLQRFAELASVALDNARLITAAMRQSQELNLLHQVRTAIARELDLARIAILTVEAIAEAFGYTLVSLYMLEGDTLVLQHQVGYETVIPKIAIAQGVAGRVARTGEPVLLEDVRSDPTFLKAVEGIVSEVAVPLFDEGKPVGVLNIESRHGVKMTRADLHLMLALSDQVSIAISRARAYSALRRQNERLSILHEVTLELLNQRDMEELPQTITDQIVQLLDANGGYLALRDGEELVDRAVTPPDVGYEKTRSGPADADTPVWQVYESHKPFVTDEFSAIPSLRPQTAALGIQAMMLLPILYGEMCQGVLGTARFTPNYPFDEDDLNFGNLFSKLAAVALDNAQLHETLRQESIRDPLTGLFNRRFMEESLTQEMHRAERNSQTLAVVMMDLDHFKNINDAYGHDAGDEALRKLGLLLKTSFRGSDIACRYGGEEFTIILPETSLADAVNRMEQLRQDIKLLTVRYEGKTVSRLSGSFGIAVFPGHGKTGEQLLKEADGALYRAKQLGRDRVVTASST